LQLRAVILTEDAFMSEGDGLRGLLQRLDRVRLCLISRSEGTHQEREREDRTHTVGNETDHYSGPPYSAGWATDSPGSTGSAMLRGSGLGVSIRATSGTRIRKWMK